MEYRDYYASLGVSRDASQADVRKAYRKLARRHHPDVNSGDAEAERRFKEVNEAHAVLGDPDKRKAYDMLGANWERIQGASARSGADPFAGFAGFGAAPGVRFEYRGDAEDLAGFSDFFQTFFTGANGPAKGDAAGAADGRRARRGAGGLSFEDLLAGLGLDGAAAAHGPGAGGPRTAPLERQHLEGTVEISLEEAYRGTTRVVQASGRRLEVTIPRGVASGQRIRLTGTAGEGPAAGHIYLEVRVSPHPAFTRRGATLERDLPVSLAEAVVGAEVPVPTLKGRVLLRLPAETQNGRTFRLAGQGMPNFKADGFGDLLVKVRVVLPTGLDEEARRRFGAFAEHVQQPDPRDRGPATLSPTGSTHAETTRGATRP